MRVLHVPASVVSAQDCGTAISLTDDGGFDALEKEGEKSPLSGRNWNSGTVATAMVNMSIVHRVL